ncbi:MAG: hypothetical protein WCI95_10425 [bacterium]
MKINQRLEKILLLFFLSSAGAFAATNAPLALRYARLYERELAGERAGLVPGYRALYSAAKGVDKELSEKILNRIGMCERKSGRKEQARTAWRELVETYPLSDPVVASARDSLKALEWEMDRVQIIGSVRTPSPPGEKGASGKCLVFAGEWGNEPPVLTGGDGVFRMGRRAAGTLPDGNSYGLVYAEHSASAMVGTEVWMGPGATGLTVALTAPVTLAGRVLDHSGTPVAEARLRITGFKAAPFYPVPLPIDRLIPPAFSGTNGTFVVEGLPAGLRYEVIPEKSEYRGVLEGDVIGRQGSNSLYATAKTFANEDWGPVPAMAWAGRRDLDSKAISNLFTAITWLRGSAESGTPCRWEDLKGHIVVFHFGSAYGEASLRAQYTDERGGLSRLMELYGDQGVLCLWVLPDGEGRGEAVQLALGLYPELAVGVRGEDRGGVRDPISGQVEWGEMVGNVVLGRDGSVQAVCTDQQVFRVVKRALQK